MGDEWKRKPWYREADRWLAEAAAYCPAAQQAVVGPVQAETANHYAHAVAKLIFESNYMEGAGVSAGETRRLVDAAMVQDHISRIRPEDLLRAEWWEQRSPAGKTLGERQVIQHLSAFWLTRVWAAVWWVGHHRSFGVDVHWATAAWPHAVFEPAPDASHASRPSAPVYPSDVFVKSIHSVLGGGLMPGDSGVDAGAFRADARVVTGADVVFPAHGLLPACMDQFYARTRELMDSGTDACLAAAEVSYEFVRIHPFPDFNGRLSRLLMNMVLMAKGLPFPIALKGDAKGKNRYFRSLRLANAGDIKPYAALIAKHVVEACEAIDANLERAGLPTLRSTFDEPPG